MLNKIKRQFFAGLVLFVPISLTIYFIHLFFLLMSQTLLPILMQQRLFLIHQAAIRPLSFVLTIILIWFMGVVASNIIGKQLVNWFESLIHRIPFFRLLYEAIQKVTEAVFGINSNYQSVVLIQYPRKETYTFGFVTSQLSGKNFGAQEDYFCVFVPTVPNPTSGILLYIPKSEVIHLNISIEEVAKILVSHGFASIPDSAFQPHS